MTPHRPGVQRPAFAHALAAQESARIQGGNWSMQGFRRSGHVHDEDECHLSIAEFMDAQERLEVVD